MRNELIIGSTAIKKWYPEKYTRQPKDLDIAVIEDRPNTKGVEYLKNPILFKYQKGGFLIPEYLLTLKISHMFWEFNWKKHMWDIQFLLDQGVSYNSTLLQELIIYWEKTKPKVKRSNLELDAKEFFTNAINSEELDHDYLHTLINPTPMYTKLLKEGKEVELDENKWLKLSFEDRCKVIFEETAVMGYERYKSKYYKAAYEIQLEQNIQKHFPRYIAIFAILNYKKVVTPMFNFIKMIENGLQKN